MAESEQMAEGHPVLAAVFRLRGVAEAILEAGRVWVRPGHLFSWEELEPSVLDAVEKV